MMISNDILQLQRVAPSPEREFEQRDHSPEIHPEVAVLNPRPGRRLRHWTEESHGGLTLMRSCRPARDGQPASPVTLPQEKSPKAPAFRHCSECGTRLCSSRRRYRYVGSVAEPDPLAAATEVTRPNYTVTGVNRAAPGTGVRRLVEKSVVVKSTTYGTGSPIVR